MDHYNFKVNNIELQSHLSPNHPQYDFGYKYDNVQSVLNNYDLKPNLQHSGNINDCNVFIKLNDETIKTDDELWVETWLSKTGKIHINLDSSAEKIKPLKKKQKETIHAGLQIHKAKLYLKHCFHIIQKLQKTKENLQNNVSTMTSSDWKSKTVEIGALKDELASLMANFDNSMIVTMLRKTIEIRKKKRRQKKQQKINRRENRQRLKEDAEKMHESIDQWLLNMKDAVDRTKMEENMRKDADCVLYEVNKKKADAKKQLSLLCGLVKLRSVREQTALQRGEKMSLEDKKAFALATDKLIQAWESSVKVYAKEEKGLKMMLEQNATDDAVKNDKEKKLLQEWDIAFFGHKHIPTPAYYGLTAAEKNFETFVAIRKSWDTFLVAQNDMEGTTIPIEWILPSASSIESWTNYLEK